MKSANAKDIKEAGKLIEVIDSNWAEDIIETLKKQEPLEVREQVEEVSVDIWGGFPKVVQEVFPNAEIVIDRFHVMKAVNEELNKITSKSEYLGEVASSFS